MGVKCVIGGRVVRGAGRGGVLRNEEQEEVRKGGLNNNMNLERTVDCGKRKR